MPFAYFGAKHGLADRYPPPAHPVVVEPFAGSAAYSVRHAATITKALVYDIDPAVVDLWHRVKSMTVDDIREISERIAVDHTTTDPLVAASSGGEQLTACLAGKTRKIMPRMREAWPHIARRIESTLPHLHKFDVRLGSYAEADPIEATWFIDPPYMAIMSDHAHAAGNTYRHGSSGIDYVHLAEWCKSRRGLVIVCEQSPASWLPFYPLANQRNGAGIGSTRVEVVWRNDAEQQSLFSGAA